MAKEIPNMGENPITEDLIMAGALPEIKRVKGNLVLQNIEKEDLAEIKEVRKARQELVNFIAIELPFADEELLEQMSGKQLLDLYLFYYNQPANIAHFTDLYQTLRQEKLSEDMGSDEARAAYLAYLMNKQPAALQTNQLKLAGRQDIDPELIEELAEDITLDVDDQERIQRKKMIQWLEKVHTHRITEKSKSFIGFHVAQTNKIKGDISSAHGIEQTNINSDVGQIHTGARFFTTTTDPLYYPGGGEQYLYLTYANESDLGRMYDPSEKACFSHGALERVPFDDLPPIPLTPKVLQDLDARFGTS
ncbi:hypothetical protein ACFL2U_01355 [Patescibacteria group bacterium]